MATYKFYLNGVQVDEPIGWDSVSWQIQRSETFGLDQMFSTELTFTGDLDRLPGSANGAGILRLEFEDKFINGSVDVEILTDFKKDGQFWSFVGRVDFRTYSETGICDGCSDGVTVSIKEDEFRDYFKGNQDVEIDLINTTALDGTDVGEFELGTVRLHSQELFLQAFAKNLAVGKGDIFPEQIGGGFVSAPYQMPFYFQNKDFKGPFGSALNPTGVGGSSTNVLFVNNASYTRTFTWEGKVEINGFYKFANPTSLSASFCVVLVIYDTSLPSPFEVSVITLATSSLIPYNDNANLNFDFLETITLQPNQRATIQARWFLPSPIFNAAQNRIELTVNKCELLIKEFTKSTATTCQGVYIFDFLKRIVQKITGRDDRLISNYFGFGGCYWNNLITTGLFIRNGQLADNQAVQISVTFKKVYESLDAMFCLGWGFEKDAEGEYLIRIEPLQYWFSNQIQSSFEDVDGITRKAKIDWIYNTIKLGYSDEWKNIAVSGVFESHTSRNYSVRNLALTDNSSSKFEKLSDIIASGYAIEFNRRLQDIKEDSGSSDRPNDYDLFIIWLNREELTIPEIEGTGYEFPGETGSVTFAPGTVSYGSNFIDFSNAPIDNIYNVLHTPARIAIRWWKWLGMSVFGLSTANQKLFFQVGEYFTNLQTRLNDTDQPFDCNEVLEDGNTIFENMDIFQDFSAQPVLLKPIEYGFTVPQQLCDFVDYLVDGKKNILFSCGNSIFAGYLLSAENEPSSDSGGETTFTLIGSNASGLFGDFNNDFSNDFNI
jgi:hypothetical protein